MQLLQSDAVRLTGLINVEKGEEEDSSLFFYDVLRAAVSFHHRLRSA